MQNKNSDFLHTKANTPLQYAQNSPPISLNTLSTINSRLFSFRRSLSQAYHTDRDNRMLWKFEKDLQRFVIFVASQTSFGQQLLGEGGGRIVWSFGIVSSVLKYYFLTPHHTPSNQPREVEVVRALLLTVCLYQFFICVTIHSPLSYISSDDNVPTFDYSISGPLPQNLRWLFDGVYKCGRCGVRAPWLRYNSVIGAIWYILRNSYTRVSDTIRSVW